MMKTLYSFIFVSLLMAVNAPLLEAQVLVGELTNPSFEDSAQVQDGWPFAYRLPYNWWNAGCNHNSIDNTPDWQPGYRDLQFPAQHGNRYMALITRPRGIVDGVYYSDRGHSEESINQNFRDFVLEDEKHYFFSMYLANNFEGSTYLYSFGRCKLAVYIQPYRDSEYFYNPQDCYYFEEYKVWESPLIDHKEWRQYYVSFYLPKIFSGEYLKIAFKTEWIEDSSETGNVLIDNLSPIYEGIIPDIELELGEDTFLCVGDTLFWDVEDKNEPLLQYEWENGSTDPKRIITESGRYSVRVYGIRYEFRDSITVTYEELSTLDVGADTTLCPGDTFQRTVAITPDIYSILWQDSIQGATYTLTEPGVYEIKVVGEACLLAQDTLTISPIRCTPGFIMSNIFSPNGDQINDRFLPAEAIDIRQPFIRVWDRWGRICYESHDLMAGWDGTLNGKPCTEGVYYWQCEYGNVKGERFMERGVVTLLR